MKKKTYQDGGDFPAYHQSMVQHLGKTKKRKKAQDGYQPISADVPHPQAKMAELQKIHPMSWEKTSSPNPIDWSGAITEGLLAFDAVLPREKSRVPIVQPQDTYNQHPYGTGSQAIYKDGGKISKTGYKRDSKDKNAPFLTIPTGDITMQGVDFPVYGVDNAGNGKMMYPGNDYKFPGNRVTEYPMMQRGGKVEKKLGNASLTEGTPYLNQMRQAYTDSYHKSIESSENQYQYTSQDYQDSIPLTQGKYNSGRIPKTMINRAEQAAKKAGIDPYDLLALAGQESTFGAGYVKRAGGTASEQSVISGWDLDKEPQMYSLYLADKKIPGITPKKTSHGYEAHIDDEAKVEQYLSQHQDVIKQYQTALGKNDYSNNSNFFDLAAQKIKKEGFSKYNPGDPNYVNDISKSKALLMKDKGLSDYIANNKFQAGGIIPGLTGTMASRNAYKGEVEDAKDGKWIQKAVNPSHKGYCTPMTKATCTPHRKALAKTFKKHHGFHKAEDGLAMEKYFNEGETYDVTPEDVQHLISHNYDIKLV